VLGGGFTVGVAGISPSCLSEGFGGLPAAEIAKKSREIRERMDKVITEVKGLGDFIEKAVPKDQQTELLQQWKLFRGMLLNEQINVTAIDRSAQTLRMWEAGHMKPQAFRDWLVEDIHRPDDEEIQFFDNALGTFHLDREDWNTFDPSRKIQFVEDVRDDIKIPVKLQSMNEDLTGWGRFIEDAEGHLKMIKQQQTKIQKAKEMAEKEKKEGKGKKGDGGGGIEWYSLRQLYSGVKSWVEAMGQSWQQWEQLKVARVAQGAGNLGRWIPYGKDAQAILDSELEGKHDEVKEKYKKFLESRKMTFHDIQGQLEINKNDGNRFRAVLEYAASKGWLYKMDVQTQTVFGHKLQAGTTLPPTWSENDVQEYFIELGDKNGSGAEDMKKRGYSRVQTFASIPPIIQVLQEEIERKNYWSIYGIMQRAMEKGKEGETSTWVAITIMRAFREDSDMREYLPVDLLDNLGDLGITHPAWTNTYFKLDRFAIQDWQKSDDPSQFSNAGKLAKVITQVESDLVGSGMDPHDPDFDRTVAKVLAAQTVEVQGNKISIFNNNYNWYREDIAKTATSIDPGKADDDFFNPATGGSEVLLQGKEGVATIVAVINGSFPQATLVKSQYFLQQVLDRHDDLFEDGLNQELENFRDEMRGKFDEHFRNALNDGRSGKFANVTSVNTNEYVVLGLLKRGLLSPKIFAKLAHDQGTALAYNIINQIRTDPQPSKEWFVSQGQVEQAVSDAAIQAAKPAVTKQAA